MIRRYGIGCLIVVAGVGLIVAIVHECCRGWTPSAVDGKIRAACPVGTSRAEVEAWLATDPFPPAPSRGIFEKSHADQPSRFEWGDMSEIKEIKYYARHAHLNPANVGRVIRGDVPDPNVDPVCAGTIEVYFFFDKDDKLIKHYLYVWICSL